MSTAYVATAAITSASIGTLAIPLVIALGIAAIGTISSVIDEAQKNKYRNELAKSLLLIDNEMNQEMTALIDEISDANEKKMLLSQLHNTSEKVKAEIVSYRNFKPDEDFRELRQKILSVQLDEKMANSLNDEFREIESSLKGVMPDGFIPEWNSIRNDLKKANALALQKKIKSLSALLNRARFFAEKALHVASISVSDIEEEKYEIKVNTVALQENVSEDYSSIISDIVDFGTRVAYFDESEARKLRPLMDEATSEKTRRDKFRLTAIRQEVKMRYGKLKERVVLTETFKQEIRDILPLVRRARGAEEIIVRMEDLLTARVIPRTEFIPLYKDIKTLIAEQLERITDEIAALKIGKVLDEMGYSLVESDGKGFSAREVNYIESPYEGYQVKVRVDKGGTLSTRLVRVAESEEEKNSPSEYQRQKDIEIGKKWCEDLEAFQERMKSEGLEFKTTFRSEPEEQPLDVVVKSGAGKKRRSQESVEKLKEKHK